MRAARFILGSLPQREDMSYLTHLQTVECLQLCRFCLELLYLSILGYPQRMENEQVRYPFKVHLAPLDSIAETKFHQKYSNSSTDDSRGS